MFGTIQIVNQHTKADFATEVFHNNLGFADCDNETEQKKTHFECAQCTSLA